MSEVGAILIVGGNIAGYTRVMTTTITLETDNGNFELAMVLWIILLIISFLINIFLFSIQKKEQKSSSSGFKFNNFKYYKIIQW